MTFLAKVRSLESYYSKIKVKSPSSQRGIQNTIKKFNLFCTEHFDRPVEDIIQELKKAEEEAVFDTIQLWINWIDSPNSIRVYWSHLNPYLYYRGIKILPMDVKQNLDFGKIHQEELHPMSLEEYRKILEAASYKNKVFYLLMGSSGMRPIEASHIRKCDLEFKERIVIHVPARWTKLKRSKTTFASKEVSDLIKPILDKRSDNEYIFPYSCTSSITTVFASYRKRVGLDQRYDSNNRGILTPMNFRAWFRSKIDRLDNNLSLKWAGQKGYNMSYDRMELDEQLEKYIEFEPELLVYENNKRETKIEKEYKKKIDLMWDLFQNTKQNLR